MASLSALYDPRLSQAPSATPRGLVILLHGWGANAEDLIGLCPMLRLKGVQFACPNAPLAHPYSPTGRMWYDLESPRWEGLTEARSQLNQWIDDTIQVAGLSLERVILAGFSQGGAMALEVGLERSLGGLIVLSGYLHPELAAGDRPAPPASPMLILHGQQDAVVPIQAAQQTQARLKSWDANFEFQVFPQMGHEISTGAIERVRRFVDAVLSKSETE